MDKRGFGLVALVAAALYCTSIQGMPTTTDDPAAAEYGQYFQGDIMEPIPRAFAGLINRENRWPNNVVVYKLDSSLPDSTKEKVLEAMSRVTSETGDCVRFREWNAQADGIECVVVRKGNGCSATIGYWSGRTTSMNLAEHCSVGNIMHELQHSLGVEHQQSRPDRDNYVKIEFDNVTPGLELNFMKESARYFDSFGLDYDFGSQMHYSLTAFSRNGQSTILPLPGRLPDGVEVGQRQRMSRGDVALVRAMYQCSRLVA